MSSFEDEVRQNIEAMCKDSQLKDISLKWLVDTAFYKYSYNFRWMGRPIIQNPEDIVAMQEIIWKLQPQLIIETGVAHGGSVIFYASMLELVGGDGEVIGVDIEIRPHNFFPQEPQRPGLCHCLLDMRYRNRVFRSHINVTKLSAYGIGGDKHPLQNRVGISLKD